MVQSCFVKLLRALSISLRLALLMMCAIVLLGSSSLPAGDSLEKVRAYTRQIEFDFAGWTLNTLRLKLFEAALGTGGYLTESERHQIVLEYLALVQQIQQEEGDLKEIYADPEIGDPRSASAALRAELDGVYARREKLGPLAESILQEQISYIVAEMGLSLGGQVLPPVLYHSTPLPLILIISPREVIRLDESVALNGNLSIEEQVALEKNVEAAIDVSSLVENIGGLGLYPTMVVESNNLDWLSEVVSHEWVHNYLTLRPLGINYESSPEMRVINETVASIAGKEIGRAVLERFYPELAPPPLTPTAPPPGGTPPPPAPEEPPAFDFRKEMQITRLNADRLLAEGKIDEAERYMEARREIFWENGYHWLRRLNQAYFAFHGAYADEPGGAVGVTEDPVGAAVRALRSQSASLVDFLNRVSWVTSFEQLKQLAK
jgi:hypothetical protein